jgi:hypothetical protein
MCKWYEFVPKKSGPIEKEFLHDEGQGKLLNRSCIGKCNDYNQLIMRDERMKNHDARITYSLYPLLVVLYIPRSVLVARMCDEKSSVHFKTSSHQ